MAFDPKTRRELAKQGRLWALSLVCATGGAVAVAQSGRVAVGVFVFGICLLVFGGGLYVYEKRHQR